MSSPGSMTRRSSTPQLFDAIIDVPEYGFAFSRRDAPGVLHFVGPLEIRGRREDRVRAAPAVSQAMCI
jgi:hypothetical protein